MGATTTERGSCVTASLWPGSSPRLQCPMWEVRKRPQFDLALSGGSSAHAHVQRLSMIEDGQAPVALGAGQARLARQLLQPGERRVQPLVAERERPIAGGDEQARLEIVEGVERVER